MTWRNNTSKLNATPAVAEPFDAIVHTGQYIADILGITLHIIWVGGILLLLPGAKERVVFYLLANCASGCLGIQVGVSY